MLWCHQLIGFRVTWRHERCSLLNMALTSATSTPHQWRESARVGLRGPMEQLSWLLIGALIITTVNLWHHGGTIWSVRLVTLTSYIFNVTAPTPHPCMQISSHPRAKGLEERYLLCSMTDCFPERGQHCHLVSLSLLPPTRPPGIASTRVWKYPVT